MIRPVKASDFKALHRIDPFYPRVLSLYESYGTGYDFADFWTQEDDGEAIALISRFEDKFSLFLTEKTALDEVAAFLRFQGANAVMFDSGFDLEIPAENAVSGDVLRYCGEDYDSDLEIYEPDFSDVYTLLLTCESEIFRVPPKLSFLSDVTHRKNLGKCVTIGTAVGDRLASSVMTVSETESAAIIGAVATHPDCRRRGLSRELVRTLACRIRAQGRAVYVFSASGQNTRFYQNSGFAICAEFTELLGSLS